MSTAIEIRASLVRLPSHDRPADVARSLVCGDIDVRRAVFQADARESGISIADWLELKRGTYVHIYRNSQQG